MQIVTPKSSHWYRKNGLIWEPCHEVPKKRSSGMKPVTLREARELNLVPSVTNILGIIEKPALTDWRITQAIMAGIKTPRLLDENDEDYGRRIYEVSQTESKEAADFGTRIHDAVEKWFSGEEYDIAVSGFVHPVIEWATGHIDYVYATEALVGADGYAGTMDLHCSFNGNQAVVDFKTQKVRNGTPTWYPEWPLQLSAYAAALPTWPEVYLVSVVIGSVTEGRVWHKIWNEENTPEFYFEQFNHFKAGWCYLKNYWPNPTCQQHTT